MRERDQPAQNLSVGSGFWCLKIPHSNVSTLGLLEIQNQVPGRGDQASELKDGEIGRDRKGQGEAAVSLLESQEA